MSKCRVDRTRTFLSSSINTHGYRIRSPTPTGLLFRSRGMPKENASRQQQCGRTGYSDDDCSDCGIGRGGISTIPSESRKVFSALAETIELLRGAKGESTKDAERSRAKAGLPLEESPEPDSDERPSEREESEGRGNKRKNISRDSDENQEKTEVRRYRDEHRKYDFSSLAPGATNMLGCSCGKFL
ncbi:unnamed protein product [Clavelina lepadiformis]|uniref:Uncharacterized protein n=1 Tax=Clavelina lepadiformis TaxID=159417 RepID=A0ABP0FBX4_CLALP